MESLTPKQIQILEWIQQYLNTRHTMPSRREIAEGLGLSSPATIQQHIEALEKKGYLKRGDSKDGNSRKSRSIQWTARSKKFLTLVNSHASQSHTDFSNGNAAVSHSSKGGSPTGLSMSAADENPGLPSSSISLYEVPLLGTIAAGYPIEVYPEARSMTLPLELFLSSKQAATAQSEIYMLTVRGDSMIDEGIHPNDLVILRKSTVARNGETVAALLNGEATLKKYYKSKAGAKTSAELHPANPKYPVIPVTADDRFEIQGVMVGLIRKSV